MTLISAVNQHIVRRGMFEMSRPRTPKAAPGFRMRLQHHLTDVKMGQSWRSETVYRSLQTRHSVNQEVLAGIDAQSYKQYLGLMSGMDYAQQARLATTVHEMTQTIAHFQDLHRTT